MKDQTVEQITQAFKALHATYGDSVTDVISLLVEFSEEFNPNSEYDIRVVDRHVYVSKHNSESFDFDADLILDAGTGEVVIDKLGAFGEPLSVMDLLNYAMANPKTLHS